MARPRIEAWCPAELLPLREAVQKCARKHQDARKNRLKTAQRYLARLEAYRAALTEYIRRAPWSA